MGTNPAVLWAAYTLHLSTTSANISVSLKRENSHSIIDGTHGHFYANSSPWMLESEGVHHCRSADRSANAVGALLRTTITPKSKGESVTISIAGSTGSWLIPRFTTLHWTLSNGQLRIKTLHWTWSPDLGNAMYMQTNSHSTLIMQNHKRRQRLGAHSEMAHPGFGHLWQQSEMSDIEMVLAVGADADPVGVGATEVHKVNRTVLQQFPAILCF